MFLECRLGAGLGRLLCRLGRLPGGVSAGGLDGEVGRGGAYEEGAGVGGLECWS